MTRSNAKIILALVLLASVAFLACRTADLIGGVVGGQARPTATRAVSRQTKAPARTPTKPKGTPDPNAAFDFVPDGAPHCSVGDNAASVVKGRVTNEGDPVVGQLVQASSGPGAEPISDFPAMSDEEGNFQVTFVCDGKACNGAFWIWLVDKDMIQSSPFVQFIFDNQCRSGTVNFRSR